MYYFYNSGNTKQELKNRHQHAPQYGNMLLMVERDDSITDVLDLSQTPLEFNGRGLNRGQLKSQLKSYNNKNDEYLLVLSKEQGRYLYDNNELQNL